MQQLNGCALTGCPTYFKRFTAFAYIVSWMAASSGLVMLNKYTLSTLNFHYPLTLSSLGMAFSALASIFRIHIMKSDRLERTVLNEIRFGRVLMLGFLVAVTNGLGNLAYLYLSVSFIQILKAATPLFTMLLLFVTRLEHPSNSVIAAVSIIAVGTVISSWGELAFSMAGFAIMLLADLGEACKLTAMHFYVGHLKLNLIEGLYLFMPAATVWMLIFIVPLELSRMQEEHAALIVKRNAAVFLLTSVLGFVVNLLSFGVIQYTSALTFKVLGQVKNVGVITYSIFLFGSVVSFPQAFGYACSLAGFVLYDKSRRSLSAVASTARS